MDDENVAQTGKQIALFPLPETRPISARPATFLASVDQLVSKLWSAKDWRQYLDALTNKSAITGNWVVDRGLAAKRVQDAAKDAGLMEVATAKLSKIMRALETILRRDHLGRRQRIAALNVQSAE